MITQGFNFDFRNRKRSVILNMKSEVIDNFTNYVNLWETYNKDFNKEEYKNSNRHDMLKQFAELYLECVGGVNVLYDCVKDAIDKTNGVLQILYDNDIIQYIQGQTIARVIEGKLAESINLDNIEFEHGKENRYDKDLECINISKDVKHKFKDFVKNNDIKFDVDDTHSYGLEIKTSQGSGITGNKSYAVDEGGKKSKNGFYILINYKAPIEIPESVDDQTSDSVKELVGVKFKIKSFDSYFGYIEQSDWVASEHGNAASLQMKILKEKRLIKL